MKIIMVWGQRRCRYPGEYAPELIEAMSEYADDDNSVIIDNAFKNASLNTDFISVQIVEANISDDVLTEILSTSKVELEDIHAV